ncbi:MAG: hypothetical protein CMJ25_33010 [Phycisphaerae bacterium]|nr:hypothetical protein [Phycisphaerae bacterium]
MPEFVHVFQSGKMNKDLDERLVPNGEYRDALNLDLANSENGNVGSLQNIKGTLELKGKLGQPDWSGSYIDALSNPVCIGSIRNDVSECIYWFIASNNISTIAEYNQTTGDIAPVIVDTLNILKFSEDYLITGINIIEDFLFWTDDQTEPKKINIKKFKTGSTDFLTHTKIPQYIPDQQTYSENLTGQPNFVEADVTVIKLSPLAAPTITASASKYGDDIPGTGLLPLSTTMTTASTVNFTYVENTVLDSISRVPLDTYGEYLANIAIDPAFYADSSIPNWNGEITFTVNTVPTAWALDDIIELETDFTTEFYVNYEYKISIKLTAVNNTTITGQIQAISSDIQTFRDSNEDIIIYNWKAILVEESPMFEYVFPRFAFRWKFIDNEYSCFSPFSEVAFVGGKFEYLASDGYNEGMTNNIRLLEIGNLAWGSQEVVELDILFKESNSQAVYSVETLKRSDFPVLPSTFQVETELIGAIVEANQILRPWDNVPRAAKSQELIGNRIVYGNYLQNYNVDTTTLNLTNTPTNHPAVADPAKIRFPFPSVKSIRTYQAGVSYIDAYGRETPIFTSKQGSTKIDISDSNKTNKLTVTPTNIPPSFATHYKFFVKEISNEYYNLALDRFYEAEDGNVWLSFPSSERNKVDEETYLILKKQHDTDQQVLGFNRYKILSIEAEAPEFISTFDTVITSSIVEQLTLVEVGFLSLNFKGPMSSVNAQFGSSLNGGKVRFTKGASVSDIYDVSISRVANPNNDATEIDYNLVLDRPLGPDAAFLEDVAVGQAYSVTILEDEVKRKPEFAGRFFVKIQRNFAFDTNVISSFAAMPVQYSILDSFQPDRGLNNANNPGPNALLYADYGATSPVFLCTNKASALKVVGWNGGVGHSITNTDYSPDAYKLAALQPPTRGSRKFGVIYVGEKANGGGEYINQMFGNSSVSQYGGGPMYDGNWAGFTATPDGFLSPGAVIRFQNKTDGSYSQTYNVIDAIGQRSFRGRRTGPGGGCEHSETGYNQKYVIYIELDKPIAEDWMPLANDWNQLETVLPSIQALEPVISAGTKLTSNNPAIFETEPKESIDLDLYYEASDSLPISNYNTESQHLNWMNCYSYGTGVESNRIRDDYNAVFIDKGPKVSTVLDEPYAAERRGSGFIFSQIFNSTSGINRLNQFIQALPITKDLNPIHGTIQKLHARDTDLITLCEDKCFRVLANKDALFNADGNSNVTSNNAVLGQTVPYAGDFGISKNPESFADYGFRVYFADKNRGSVIRLSRDGITEISSKGMDDFFSDNLRYSNKLIGSYDEDKGLYNLKLDNITPEWTKILSTDTNYQLTASCENPSTLNSTQKSIGTTVSFKESVNGWTSRKSFLPESGISLNNIYYTFKNGLLWQHNINNTYNNFYGNQYLSSFNVVINELPNVVKGYSTLNYTGTRSRELEYEYNNKWYSIAEINANQTIPTSTQIKTEGWRVDYVRTNLESGEIKEFENKEGKYFNYIKALHVCKTGDGIGNSDVDAEPQDYLLTVTIDPDCSSSGDVIPDTSILGFYEWDVVNSPVALTNIELNTPQEAKCNIENFYNILNQDYTNVTVASMELKYISTVGLAVGTVLYDSSTLLPFTTSSGVTILYTNTSSVSNPSLDANNSQSVPDTYKLITINASGTITSIIQYNTLAICIGNPTNTTRGTSALSGGANVPYLFFSLPALTNSELVCAIKNFMETWIALPNEDKSTGWSVPKPYWYDPFTFSVGTQLYTKLNNGEFKKKNVNSAGDPGYPRKEVYNLDGGGVMPFGSTWTEEANKPDDNWVIVSTNGTGIITAIDVYNTYSYTCP